MKIAPFQASHVRRDIRQGIEMNNSAPKGAVILIMADTFSSRRKGVDLHK